MDSELITHRSVRLERLANTPRGRDVIAFEVKYLRNAIIIFFLCLNCGLGFPFHDHTSTQKCFQFHGFPERFILCNIAIDN